MDKVKPSCEETNEHPSEHNRTEPGIQYMKCKQCGKEIPVYEDSQP